LQRWPVPYFRHCQRPERHRQVRRRVSGH
jgi:hypothetical protein